MMLADFGFTEGINEIIALTQNEDGGWNAAPIGIIVENPRLDTAKARLYRNRTRANLERNGIMFANVTDDAIIFAISSFGNLSEDCFSSLNPPVIRGSMAWCRFEAEMKGGVAFLKLTDGEVIEKRVRAVNRGLNAVIEALVHATRYVAIKDEEKRKELLERIHYYREITQKCGSEREKRAFEIIMEKLARLFLRRLFLLLWRPGVNLNLVVAELLHDVDLRFLELGVIFLPDVVKNLLCNLCSNHYRRKAIGASHAANTDVAVNRGKVLTHLASRRNDFLEIFDRNSHLAAVHHLHYELPLLMSVLTAFLRSAFAFSSRNL